MPEPPPNVIILAGANGAGKTTSARTLLAQTLEVMTFVNADVIAQGLAGFDPDSAAVEASRIMLERLHQLAAHRANFAFETTLAARSYAGWLRKLRSEEYAVNLFYFWLVSADLAVARVAQRVRQGGHAVPEATIRQRYHRSLKYLFTLYLPIVSTWTVYDNTVADQPDLVAWGGEGLEDKITNEAVWQQMRRIGANG